MSLNRTSILLVTAAILFATASPLLAGVRSDMSEATLNDPPLDCQFRFNESGSLDTLICSVVVRDNWWGFPVPDCSTTVQLSSQSGALCCCSVEAEDCRQWGFSDEEGRLEFRFSRIGGHGTLVVNVSSHCYGNVVIANIPVEFTSPDLDGSCEESGSALGVIDLGVWAAGLPPGYALPSDYDCSGNVGVIDLGRWASSLGKNCGAN